VEVWLLEGQRRQFWLGVVKGEGGKADDRMSQGTSAEEMTLKL